ncbi:hypothetical protein TSOC_011822 [Tetrabaena socialis]|uniref:Uncharacterized protein n=1 Tax=Tetrabaena socialis TaxID=47790 RepID=A0A2J7ZPN3_9CHLO|nr:hypothetical protein TSOC_011822 [Tetrabaena socialis]|eukprot:PNH02221.1 hypothetical protein TSOC_011822 [Tetrabaena socialis]
MADWVQKLEALEGLEGLSADDIQFALALYNANTHINLNPLLALEPHAAASKLKRTLQRVLDSVISPAHQQRRQASPLPPQPADPLWLDVWKELCYVWAYLTEPAPAAAPATTAFPGSSSSGSSSPPRSSDAGGRPSTVNTTTISSPNAGTHGLHRRTGGGRQRSLSPA